MGLLDDLSGAYNNQEIDPNYGIPKGMLFQQAMNNLANTSGILLAAGQGGGPPGTRAQILAKLGEQNPNKGLMEMAQLRNYATEAQLRQQQLAQMKADAAYGQGLVSYFGGGSMSAPSSANPAPSIGEASGVAAPASGAPMPINPIGAANAAPADPAPALNTTQTAQVTQAARTGNYDRFTSLTGLPQDAFLMLAPGLAKGDPAARKELFEAMAKKAAEKQFSLQPYGPGQQLKTDQFGNAEIVGNLPAWVEKNHEKLGTMRDSAQGAANNIEDTKVALGYLNQAIAGPGGDFKLWVRSNQDGLKRMLGADEGTIQAARDGDVVATNTVKSLLGRMIAEKGRAIFGGGQGFTEGDRKSVERWAGGDFNSQDIPSIRSILQRGMEGDKRTISQYGDARRAMFEVYKDAHASQKAPLGGAYPDIKAQEKAPAATQGQSQGGQGLQVVNHGGYRIVIGPDGSRTVYPGAR